MSNFENDKSDFNYFRITLKHVINTYVVRSCWSCFFLFSKVINTYHVLLVLDIIHFHMLLSPRNFFNIYCNRTLLSKKKRKEKKLLSCNLWLETHQIENLLGQVPYLSLSNTRYQILIKMWCISNHVALVMSFAKVIFN